MTRRTWCLKLLPDPPWHDRRVTDGIPADLIQAKREFYVAEAALAAMSDADADVWREAFTRQAELALAVHRHPAFEGLDQVARFKLDEAASKAARADA